MSLVTNCSRTLSDVLLLLVALALLACLPPTAHAQVTLFVSGTGDPSPVPFCGATRIAQTFGSVSCPSLRAAIRHANTNGNSRTDTIVLQGGSSYALSIRGPNEDNALTGDLDIRSNVRITTNSTALGSIATVQGGTGWDDRMFHVLAGVVQIENLFIGGGHVVAPGGSGGGISNLGTLTLTNCTVIGNRADVGAGGISNEGTLSLINSAVFLNSATSGAGGGINNRGTLTLTTSTISQNDAGGDGGGIHHNGLNSTLTNSTISGNRASRGGGIATLGLGALEPREPRHASARRRPQPDRSPGLADPSLSGRVGPPVTPLGARRAPPQRQGRALPAPPSPRVDAARATIHKGQEC